MARVAVSSEDLASVEFFGDVDKAYGEIGSEMSAWTLDAPFRDLKEEARTLEGMLERHEIREDDRPGKMVLLKKLKAKIEGVEGSKPNLTGQEKDALAKLVGSGKTHGELGVKIRETMFTRSEMMLGAAAGGANSDIEFKRQFEPCIELSDAEITIAKKMNCKVVNGKVSRNDAMRIYRIGRMALGEPHDPEMIRNAR